MSTRLHGVIGRGSGSEGHSFGCNAQRDVLTYEAEEKAKLPKKRMFFD